MVSDSLAIAFPTERVRFFFFIYFIMIIIISNESQEFHINTRLWQLELAALPTLHLSCLLRLGASEAWAVTSHICTASSETSPVSAGFLHFPWTTENKQPLSQQFTVGMVWGTASLSLACFRLQVTSRLEMTQQ